MNHNSQRPVQSIVLGLIAFGLIALALAGYLTPLSRVILTPLVSVQTWLSTRFQAVESFISAPKDTAQLRLEVEQLQNENARLEAQIIDLNQQLSESRITSALLDFARSHPENTYLAAQVIGIDTNPFLQYVIINRGSDDGLRRGMPVVTQQGLVGRIAAVTAGAARIQLITDTDSKVNVRLEPSRAQALLAGQITGEVALENIPQSAEVTVGDLVLTSGLGGNYPSNILIGQVTNVTRRDYDIFQTASVQPVVDFSQLEIVLVITNFRPVDISPLLPQGNE